MLDTHCHLNYIKEPVEQLVANAQKAGVEKIINIGVDEESSRISVEYSEKFDAVYATVGVHPHDAKTLTDDLMAQLREWSKLKKVVAVGEIGLDYYRDLSPRNIQKEAFIKQLELAVEQKLPVVIHTRDAHDDALAIVKDFAPRLVGGLFHCFQGDIKGAEQVFDIGFIISVGGIITFKNAEMARTAEAAPLDKIILETDAPYLTPVPYRGKTNKPEYMPFIYKKLAELKECPLSDVISQVDRTANKFFKLVETFGD